MSLGELLGWTKEKSTIYAENSQPDSTRTHHNYGHPNYSSC